MIHQRPLVSVWSLATYVVIRRMSCPGTISCTSCFDTRLRPTRMLELHLLMHAGRSPTLCYHRWMLTKSMWEVFGSSIKCVLPMTATSIIRTGAFRNRKSSYSSIPKRVPHPRQKSWFGDHYPQRTHWAMFRQQKITTLSIRRFCVIWCGTKFLGGHWEHLVVDASLISVHIERLKSFISSMNIFISVSLS